jgi:hypothetical protein
LETFKIHDKMNRIDAKLAAEEAWLASGALPGPVFRAVKGSREGCHRHVTLRDHEDSPTKFG